MNNKDTATQVDKTQAFLRYIAAVASSVSLGETDPGTVNWTYIRDQASRALQYGNDDVAGSMSAHLR